jgi:hypothetical protein
MQDMRLSHTHCGRVPCHFGPFSQYYLVRQFPVFSLHLNRLAIPPLFFWDFPELGGHTLSHGDQSGFDTPNQPIRKLWTQKLKNSLRHNGTQNRNQGQPHALETLPA